MGSLSQVLVEIGTWTVLQSRQAVDTMIMEYNETYSMNVCLRRSGPKHKLTGINPVHNSTRVASICADPGCRYAIVFGACVPGQPEDGRWHCLRFTPHSPRCSPTLKARERKTHYGADQLGAIILLSKVEDHFALEVKTAKAILDPYLYSGEADDDIGHRATDAAIARFHGTAEENFRRMDAWFAELRDAGYDAEINTCDGNEMNRVIRLREESRFKVGFLCSVHASTCRHVDLPAVDLPRPRRRSADAPLAARR